MSDIDVARDSGRWGVLLYGEDEKMELARRPAG
jgi:hypothetical protein